METIKKYFSFELSFWLIAIIYLAVIDPAAPHFSFCVFNHLGFSWCPGCGIGQSISYLLHGDLTKSLETHWFGTFALLILVYRILQLVVLKFKTNQNHGKSVPQL